MYTDMKSDTESYIASHSTPEDSLLEELSRFTHLNVVNPNMLTGNLQGRFLEFMVYMLKPRLVLEIGTYTGYSAICIAGALPDNGVLHTIDCNDELAGISRSWFVKAGLGDRIKSYTGRAQDIIPRLALYFDFVYIDGDKREYCEYYRAAMDRLATGGIIIADNVLWGGKIPAGNTRDPRTRGIIEFNELVKGDPGVVKLILPVRDGIMLIRKLD